MVKLVPVARNDPKAAPSMKQRLNGLQFSTTCYAMAVLADGRAFKGSSKGFVTADGHAERTCISKICDLFNYNHINKSAAQIRSLLDSKGLSFRYLYVDFQPCKECDPWLETLIGANIPVYFQEEFPYQEIKGQEFERTYKRFQKELFAHLTDNQQDAERVAAEVEGQLDNDWQRYLKDTVDILTKPVARDLQSIQYHAKGEETLIANILADAGGPEVLAAAALRSLFPLLGDRRARCIEPVNIVYDNTKNIEVNRVSAAVLQLMIDNNLWLAQYAGRFTIPSFG